MFGLWDLRTKKGKTTKLSFLFSAPDVELGLSGYGHCFTPCVCATGSGQRLKRPAGVSQTLRQLFGLCCYFLRVCEDGDITASDGRGHGPMRSPTDTHAGRWVQGQQWGGAGRGGAGTQVWRWNSKQEKKMWRESERNYSLTPKKHIGAFKIESMLFSIRPKCLILTLSTRV